MFDEDRQYTGPGRVDVCVYNLQRGDATVHGTDDIRAAAATARGLVLNRSRGVRPPRPVVHGHVRRTHAALIAQRPQHDARVVLVPLHQSRLCMRRRM